MGISTVPISSRTAPYEKAPTATGGYTLPRYAFIPHRSLQQVSSGFVQSPMPAGINSAEFIAPAGTQRPYPTPALPGLYGIRGVNLKASP